MRTDMLCRHSIPLLGIALCFSTWGIAQAPSPTPTPTPHKKTSRRINVSETGAPRGAGGALLEGVVQGARDTPVAGAEIEVVSLDDASQKWIVKSGPAGQFSFKVPIPPGQYSAVARSGRLRSRSVMLTLPMDKPAPLKLKLVEQKK